MAEFDERLNQILSNPDAMAQIARLAQSLNAPPPVSGNGTPPVPPPVPGNGPPLSDAPPPVPDNMPPLPDADTVAKFLPLLRDLGGDSDARRLLYALRPYLRPQKQEKIERALHLARLFRVGKRFLSQWEG
ncbi:MAG: hypothetical protein IKR84_03865 [Oscillibacter sp.]|nr:hypothetical protein [Oscillibacter sp.]